MLDWIYTALGAMMRFFNTITGSYALALLLYALVFKIVFLPFSIKQQKNQVKMAKLTPKIELIKAKYRGRTDQPTMQKQQQEIMELQQKEGYNPMSGCLPLLIQMPIIILLYTVIQGPLSYIAKPLDTYDTNILAVDGITEVNDTDYTRTDISLRLYLDYSSDSAEAKEKILSDFKETKDKKGEDKAYKNLKKTLKTKEIALVGNIRNFIDNGYTVKEDVQALLDKSEEEINTNQLAIIRNVDVILATAAEDRVALIESYGIEYGSIPNFMLWGVNLSESPKDSGFSILWIIPVLAAVAQWFTMWVMKKVNPNAATAGAQDQQTAASMKIMDLVMPGMTLFIAFSFSGMLGIYWIYQSILGLLNSLILAKLMPLPKFSEDEIKEIRRQEKEVEKAARAAAKQGPKYRSLHYIDDEDYEELPSLPEDKKTEGGKKFGGDIPEIKD